MNSEINEKLEQAQQGIARLFKIDSMIQNLESEKTRLEEKAAELKAIFEKENDDVEKMENKSLASVFYSMLGKLEEHVEKERREALAAKLKYDQALKDLEDIQYQISKLSSERLNYVDCQREYDVLYADKKEQIMKEGGQSAKKLLELEQEKNSEKINLQEIKEAEAVGKKVLESLDCILKNLNSAEGWGTWDLLGGGLISGIEKHSYIDDAKAELENTQRLLRQFHSELTDISVCPDMDIHIGSFAKFADFFFDGLIADWFMQSQIHESQENVLKMKSQVGNVVARLELMERQTDACIAGMEERMKQLIVTG